jgi:septum site-determining protein MinD
VKVIPSGISLQGFQQADPEKLRDVMKDLVDRCEFLLIDAPAGISRDGVIPLAVADKVILVVNPELASIVDALKIKILTEVVGGHVLGAILNRAGPDRSDLISQKMERVLGVSVIGTIPEDQNVRRAASSKTPVVIKFPDSGASLAIKRIAANLAGVAYKEVKSEVVKEGFIDRFARVLFRGKT